jgi:hypothetical protein
MVRYCPGGDGAFEDWVARCPDCGRTLQDEPPPEPTEAAKLEPISGDDPIVFLTSAPNEPLAQLFADVLRQEGIRSLLRPADPGFGAWASVATFTHELYVLKSQHDRAQDIIASLDDEDDADN